MALEKKVTLGESRELLLRAESFNVFNHAQFFGPEAIQWKSGQHELRPGSEC